MVPIMPCGKFDKTNLLLVYDLKVAAQLEEPIEDIYSIALDSIKEWWLVHLVSMVMIRSDLLQKFTAIEMTFVYRIKYWVLAIGVYHVDINPLSHEELNYFELTISRSIEDRWLLQIVFLSRVHTWFDKEFHHVNCYVLVLDHGRGEYQILLEGLDIRVNITQLEGVVLSLLVEAYNVPTLNNVYE